MTLYPTGLYFPKLKMIDILCDSRCFNQSSGYLLTRYSWQNNDTEATNEWHSIPDDEATSGARMF